MGQRPGTLPGHDALSANVQKLSSVWLHECLGDAEPLGPLVVQVSLAVKTSMSFHLIDLQEKQSLELLLFR